MLSTIVLLLLGHMQSTVELLLHGICTAPSSSCYTVNDMYGTVELLLRGKDARHHIELLLYGVDGRDRHTHAAHGMLGTVVALLLHGRMLDTVSSYCSEWMLSISVLLMRGTFGTITLLMFSQGGLLMFDNVEPPDAR